MGDTSGTCAIGLCAEKGRPVIGLCVGPTDGLRGGKVCPTAL